MEEMSLLYSLALSLPSSEAAADCFLLPRPQLFLGSNGCSLLLLATGNGSPFAGFSCCCHAYVMLPKYNWLTSLIPFAFLVYFLPGPPTETVPFAWLGK